MIGRCAGEFSWPRELTQDRTYKRRQAFSQSCLRAFVPLLATLAVVLPTFGMAATVGVGECLAQVPTKSIIDIYERKLFVTPDEVARYVFLTNRRDDGDRSAAVYRAHRKKGSLPGAYWVTVTEAPDSLTAETRNMRVERHDAPVPASVADALHALWEAVLKHSPTDEHAVPCAPTAFFSVRTMSGTRLSAVTVDLDQRCTALINVGESLVDYAKLPQSKRPQAAVEIEKECITLLRRVAAE